MEGLKCQLKTLQKFNHQLYEFYELDKNKDNDALPVSLITSSIICIYSFHS